MDIVDELIGSLHDPLWAAKAKGVFAGLHAGPGVLWDDVAILAGVFTGSLSDALMIDLGHFAPMKGFLMEPAVPSTISIPGLQDRALSFHVGDEIICCGRIQQQSTTSWKADSQVTLTKRPVFEAAAAWDFLHLFSGAFNGWEQAVNQIAQHVCTFRIGAQVCVDFDAEVTQIWIERYRKPSHVGPLLPRRAFEFHPHAFVHTKIFDHTILHLLAPQVNLYLTASPPCQPWSRGGRSAGLACPEGWAFADAIRTAIAGQPHLLAFECVDELASHSHFALLEAMLQWGGYSCAWQCVVPFHHLAHVHRSRWLGVWMRNDVFMHAEGPPLPIRAERLIPWSAQHYRFQVPKPLRDQLCLSQSEMCIYGDVKMLPPAKRKGIPADASIQRVLQVRRQDPFDALPTLCTSYSNQHNLAKSHLLEKGIFAMLDSDGKDFFFVDPFAHCALLGATESVVVSSKIVLAFKQIGNAISVPQAFLTLCVALKAILSWDVPVTDLVMRCWASRLTSFSSFVILGDRFAILCSVQAFINEFTIEASSAPLAEDCVVWHITHRTLGTTKVIYLPSRWTVSQVSGIFSWQFDVRSHIFCCNEDFKHCHNYSLKDFAIIVHQCQVCIDGRPFLDVCMRHYQAKSTPPLHTEPTTKICAISPTLLSSMPVSSPGQAVNPCHLEFDAIASTEAFRLSLTETEECLSGGLGMPAVFAFRTPAMSFTGLVSDASLSVPSADGPEPLSKKLRLTVSKVQEPSTCAFFLAPKEDSDDKPWFGFIRANGAIGAACLTRQPVCSNQLHIGLCAFTIECCNSAKWLEDSRICHGDVLTLSYQGPIHAGGHHAGGPHVLAPGATFEARCEFAVNTTGWLAEDEMAFWTQHIQWTAPGYAFFSLPVHWDDENGDFDFGLQAEFAIPNNRLTVIPILLRSHWCAVEVNRASHLVTVVVLGFPGPYFQLDS